MLLHAKILNWILKNHLAIDLLKILKTYTHNFSRKNKMKTKELRIGNYVNYFEDSTIFEVVQVESNGLEVKNKNEFTWIEIENFEGIPINKEWMLKLGFCEVYIDMYEIKPNVNGCECFSFHSDYNSVTISDGFGNDYLVKNIQYIHQLQNLFYSITRTELQCKAETNGLTLE